MKTLKILVISVLILFIAFSCSINKELSVIKIYDPNFRPLPAQIISVNGLNNFKFPFAITRLENKKLTLMVRDSSGKMAPFFVKGIETGFWDTRKPETDYDQVFENYRKLGSNTALFMIHWMDIEPVDGKFDFKFTDMIVKKAKQNGIKIWWVLFMHTQPHLLNIGENSWIYRLNSSEEADSVLQWVKNDKGRLLKTTREQLSELGKQFHAYGQPEIFSRTIRMIRTLAEHYKNSDDVIGVQIGNEEGFNFCGNSDYNPYTLKLYDQWSQKTGKIDTALFRKEIMHWWWQQYTTAFHEIDPYKLTSFNLDGGSPEAGDIDQINKIGADCSMYREGNIDAIGTMFYMNRGINIWKNLDMEYPSYTYDLPVLIPSEIGLGWSQTPITWGQINIINTIERGGLGFSVYCYGELVDNHGNISMTGKYYQNLVTMIEANKDIICSAVPGIGKLELASAIPGLKISQLKGEGGKTLGILYFPELSMQDNADNRNEKVDILVDVKALVSGNYKVDIYYEGSHRRSLRYEMKAHETKNILIPGIMKNSTIFIATRPDIDDIHTENN